MNILLLADQRIDGHQLQKVKKEVAAIYKDNTDIGITWFEERRSYTDYPVSWYTQDAQGIKKSWLKKICADVYDRWEEEVDNVVFLIHRDNWRLQGVWGWNISNQFSGYQVEICRFDARNTRASVGTLPRGIINSVGTIYHEIHHSHDVFIYTYTNRNIASFVKVSDWDDDITHGGYPQWDYIRYKENQESIALIAPLLRQALENRRKIHAVRVQGLRRKILQLAQQALVLTRRRLAELKKKDVPCPAPKINTTADEFDDWFAEERGTSDEIELEVSDDDLLDDDENLAINGPLL